MAEETRPGPVAKEAQQPEPSRPPARTTARSVRGPVPRFDEVSTLGPEGFIRIAYVEWGPQDAEQTVICCHGLSRNSRDFDALAQHLAGKGIRVVAPDLPGRGRSQWLSRAEDYDTELYLAAMSTLIARLDVSEVDWVGSSLGGFIGMHLATKPNTPIRRLVLNDFGARVSGLALRRIGSYVSVDRRFNTLADVEAHLREVHAPFGVLSDAQWAHIAEHSSAKTVDARFRLHYDPHIAHHISWPVLLDVLLWDLWDKIECPVLILRGAESDLFRASTAKEMTRRGRAAARGLVKLIEFEGCGHAPSLMVEEHMAPVLVFLLADDNEPALVQDLEAIG